MRQVKATKTIQVEGEKHIVLAEEAEIEKLLRRGLTVKRRMAVLKAGLEKIEERLVELARVRRKNTTTVTLGGVKTEALVTFRESLEVSDQVEDIKGDLGILFDKFFNKKTEFKATAQLKKFLDTGSLPGLEDTEEIKEKVLGYVTPKETKPNVKMELKKEAANEG